MSGEKANRFWLTRPAGARAESAAKAASARGSMAAHARPPADADVRTGASAIVRARMTGAGIQPKTAGALALEPVAVSHESIEVGADGETRIECSTTTALFDRRACAVMRLAEAGEIAASGVVAMLRFAAAGDRVVGQARVRTVDWDRHPGHGWDGLEPAEADAVAAERWRLARECLTRTEFRVANGVMRYDLSAPRAYAAAYGGHKNRKVMAARADQALIAAAERLAVAFGLEKAAPPSAADARSGGA